jgi:hypothetical protein
MMSENWPKIPKDKNAIYTFEGFENGGNVIEHIIHYHRLKWWGGKVVFKGNLASAATIFAHIPNSCFDKPTIKIMYHRAEAFINIDALKVLRPIITTIISPFGTLLLSLYLKGEIKKQYKAKWSKIKWSDPIHVITAKEAQVMNPEINICNPN